MPKDTIVAKKDGFYFNKSRLNLAGNHTWNTVQRINNKTISLDNITGNFTRTWTIETKAADFSNSIWGSTTSGIQRIKDGPFKKDGSLNGGYYRRMENVVKQLDRQDIITGVVLFEGSIQRIFPGAWENHPFNGLGPTRHEDVHTKGKWNTFQRAHVKRLVETLEPYDNVIYEVGNELARDSVPWFQRKVISWVKKWTNKPVGVSYASGLRGPQTWINNVGADWAVPAGGQRIAGFKGTYVFDTDHTSPLRPNVAGLQAAWRRGDSLWLMDGFDGAVLRNQGDLTPDRNYLNSVLAS